MELEVDDRSKDLQTLSELRRELREWKLAGKKARFWWRDDDAISDTPELRRLLSLAAQTGAVVGLAVIPDQADATLAELVATAPCCVWQHGWCHNWQHQQGDQSYSQGEFGEGRDLESMMIDAHNGQLALNRKFGETGWQRIFVPPFHALSFKFKMLLPSLGYTGLSAGHPLTPPIFTVPEVNAEFDLMNWPKRKFIGSDLMTKLLVEHLELRRQKQIPADAPIGLLSHHLAFDEDAWQFLTKLLHLLKIHDAAELVPAHTLFEQSRTKLKGIEDIAPDEVTVVVTSCGRQDLLEITLDSFLQYNTFPIKEFIIIEDGDGEKNHTLQEKYCQHPFRWLATGQRVGQIAAIDVAYKAVRTEFIFHCEDDWEFFAPGFIEKSLMILTRNNSVLQTWIRGLHDTNGHPVLDYTLSAGEIPYRLLRHYHDTGRWGIWHGFSWNPGLRRRRDYRLLGTFSSLDPGTTRQTWQIESDVSAFYQRHGFFAAILADNGGNGYVRHIGEGRRVPRDYLALGHNELRVDHREDQRPGR